MAGEPEHLTALTYVQVTARQTWENLPLVIAGGLVFCVACVPAAILLFFGFLPLMTIAVVLLVSPAWVCLLYVLTNAAEERAVSYRRIGTAFLRMWLPGMRLGLLFAVPLLTGSLVLPAMQAETLSSVTWLAAFAVALSLALGWCIGLYAYPMLASEPVAVLDAIRNGAILSSQHVVNTLGLLGFAVLGMVSAGVIGVVVFLFLPGLYGMFVVNNYRLVMQTELDR